MGLTKVPQDQEGQHYPAFLQPYTRRFVDVGEVAVALYATGESQRKTADQPKARFLC